MVDYNLGSVADRIHERLDNIPSAISGLPMQALINEERLFMEDWTNQSIGSTGIAEKFQPALVWLSMGAVAEGMQTQGIDAVEIKLGEFTKKAGKGSNIATASEAYKQRGMDKLKVLGRAVRFNRVIG